MITVKIVRDNTRRITGVFMSGHAGYAEAGSDIICAGASTLFYALANSLERICGLNAEDISTVHEDPNDGEVKAEVIVPYDKLPDLESEKRAVVVTETILTGFMTLAMSANENEDHIKYIDIVEDI